MRHERTKATIAGSIAGIVLSGCLTTMGNGKPELVTWQDRLIPMAVFQLNCPERDLTVVDLGRGEKAGVEGCGQRATYLYDDKLGWNRADVMSPVVPSGH